MNIFLEAFFITKDQKFFYYHQSQFDLTHGNKNPNELICSLIGKDIQFAKKNKPIFIHSSSWRHEPQGNIILTYIAYSDFVFPASPYIKKISVSAVTNIKNYNNKDEKCLIVNAIKNLSLLFKEGDNKLRLVLKDDTKKFFEDLWLQFTAIKDSHNQFIIQ